MVNSALLLLLIALVAYVCYLLRTLIDTTIAARQQDRGHLHSLCPAFSESEIAISFMRGQTARQRQKEMEEALQKIEIPIRPEVKSRMREITESLAISEYATMQVHFMIEGNLRVLRGEQTVAEAQASMSRLADAVNDCLKSSTERNRNKLELFNYGVLPHAMDIASELMLQSWVHRLENSRQENKKVERPCESGEVFSDCQYQVTQKWMAGYFAGNGLMRGLKDLDLS